MKNLCKFCCFLGISILAFACDESLTDINTRETTIYEIDPPNHFYIASSTIKGSSFEAFYDYTQGMMPWMQMIIGRSGNSATFVNYTSNMGQRYGLYTSAGVYIKDIQEYIKSHYTEVEQKTFDNIIQISKILFIYQGIYTSDIYGSLVYNEGWQARYGGITDPSFEQQKDLYIQWDEELKNAIAILKASGDNQRSLGGSDLAYSGNKAQWIKAANALRLRLATRWVKQDINKAKSIATEVLQSNSSELFSQASDSWIFRFETIFTEHGNFANIGANYRAAYSLLNFMNTKSDPRLRMFFRKNTYSAENVTLWNSQHPEAPIKFNENQYVGAHSNPYSRAAINRAIAPEYGTPSREIIRPDNSKLTLDTLSTVQERQFQATYESGTGISWMPCITYADFCFMAAEFSHYGVTSSKTTQTWYEEGVKSSLEFWSQISREAGISDYSAISQTEITTYLQTPGIKWESPKALELIACQAYIDNFKNTNEAWSTWKRLGYPNTTSILPIEELYDDEGLTKLTIPRRQPLDYKMPGTTGYEKNKKRIDDMAKDPDYGTPNDATGRIWWDKK